MILGIDISTSLTGFAVVGDEQLLHYSAVDLRKHSGVFEKAQVLRGYLEDLFENYQCDNEGGWGDSKFPIEQIYIEQPLHMFMRGKSSAKTLSTLMTFNVLKHLLEHEPAFHIEYTKHGNPSAGSYDKADAVVVAKAGYLIEQEKEESA